MGWWGAGSREEWEDQGLNPEVGKIVPKHICVILIERDYNC